MMNCLPQYISVSLNSINAEMHEQINKTKTFNDVLQGIEASVVAGVPTHLSYVCTKENLKHISEFLKLAKALKVHEVNLHNFLPQYGDNENEKFWNTVLTKDDQSLIEEIKRDPNSDIVSRFPVLISRHEVRRECRFPWKMLGVDGNGSISACASICHPKKEYGNLLDFAVWHNDYCNDLRDSILGEQKLYCKKCFRNWHWE